ncbi:hypothetical protein ACE6H2_023326 [Prunus campanulata]
MKMMILMIQKMIVMMMILLMMLLWKSETIFHNDQEKHGRNLHCHVIGLTKRVEQVQVVKTVFLPKKKTAEARLALEDSKNEHLGFLRGCIHRLKVIMKMMIQLKSWMIFHLALKTEERSPISPLAQKKKRTS